MLAKKKLIRNTATVDNSFKFTINTALGTGASIDLRTFLPDGRTYDFDVSFGDSNSTSYSGTTPSTELSLNHSYSIDGVYQLTFTKKVGGFSVNNGLEKLKFISVDQWGDVGIDSLEGGFYGCSNLSNLEPKPIKGTSLLSDIDNLFRGCTNLSNPHNTLLSELTEVVSANQLFYQTNISAITADLLRYNTKLVYANLMFFQTDITSIPTDLLRYNTQLVGISGMFQNCNQLSATAIPVDLLRYNILLTNVSMLFRGATVKNITEDLFYYNPLIVNYSEVFYIVYDIILPTRLFNLTNLSVVTSFNNFANCIATGNSGTGTIQDVWNYATSATSVDAFLNQIGLSNYVGIPFDWKGMVEVGTLTTDQTTLQQVGIKRTFTGIAEINWGDGNFTRAISNNEHYHDYGAPGTYHIKLGAESTTATTKLDVNSCRLSDITGLKTGLLTDLRVHANLLTSLNLSEAPISGIFWVSFNVSLNSITYATAGNGDLTDIRMQGCAFSTIDLSGLTYGGTVLLYSCPNLSSINYGTGNNLLNYLWINNCNLPNQNLSDFPTSDGIDIDADGNSFTSTEHDDFIIHLDTLGWINGTLDSIVGNSPRTSASDAAYNNLIAKGWTIT